MIEELSSHEGDPFAKGGGEQSNPKGLDAENRLVSGMKRTSRLVEEHAPEQRGSWLERMEPRVPSFSLVGMGVVVGRDAPVIGKKRDERIASMMLHEVHHLMGSGHDARLIEAKRAHRTFVGGDGETNTPLFRRTETVPGQRMVGLGMIEMVLEDKVNPDLGITDIVGPHKPHRVRGIADDRTTRVGESIDIENDLWSRHAAVFKKSLPSGCRMRKFGRLREQEGRQDRPTVNGDERTTGDRSPRQRVASPVQLDDNSGGRAPKATSRRSR